MNPFPQLVTALAAISLFGPLVPSGSCAAGDLPDATLDQIVETHAGNIYRRGQTTSLAVGITLNGRTYFKTYGFKSYADQTPANAVDEHSIFEIGSVTKVWTTVLAGQAVATGTLTSQPVSLYTTLGSLSGPLPSIQQALQPATIGDLASFTAGLPDVGDTGGNGERPTIAKWGVSDFVAAISTLVPENYNLKTPAPTDIPAPYFYSDWSTGLLGLLVTNDLSAALPANAVENWESAIHSRIATPLGMTDTYLFSPGPAQASNVVQGYQQATAEAVVQGGKIASIRLNAKGGGYSTPPAITIEQQGGSGATAIAQMEGAAPDLRVKKIVVTNPGTGFRASPRVVFGGPGTGATGQAIILNGQVAGVQVLNGGSGYQSSPAVRFLSGGPGQGASGTGIVSNGRVIAVVIDNPGSGYLPPPAVRIAPGSNVVNTVPVWAAAGALKSSASDLLKLCQLCLGQKDPGGMTVTPELAAGARYALLPLVQNSPKAPGLFTGMTWQVSTGTIEGGFNMQISKDGALPGFASYVSLVPAVNLGVVILRGNNQTKTEYIDPIGDVSTAICLEIQRALME